jgi:hypothetical protein
MSDEEETTDLNNTDKSEKIKRLIGSGDNDGDMMMDPPPPSADDDNDDEKITPEEQQPTTNVLKRPPPPPPLNVAQSPQHTNNNKHLKVDVGKSVSATSTKPFVVPLTLAAASHQKKSKKIY